MNTAILARVQSLALGSPQGRPGLQILPILGPDQAGPDYRVLDAETRTQVRVTEVSNGGHVPELRITNASSEPVFLMDGQELVGAKQNRILNTDVLVPPKHELKVPVSCVEAGRWHYTTSDFTPGKAASHTVRARKQERVYAALCERGVHDADQAAVWNDVAQSMELSETASPTRALSDAYTQRTVELDRLNAELALPEDAIGLAALHGDQLLGLDLFDRRRTLRYYWRSLIDSYAIDWLYAPETKSTTRGTEVVQKALTTAGEAVWANFSSPGLGTDYRFANPAYSGAALAWDKEMVVHLTLFPGAQNSTLIAHQAEQQANIRPRIRRRYPRSNG